MFDERQYKIFFDDKLIDRINKNINLLDILIIIEEEKTCRYTFWYNSVEPSKDWEGQQHFFTLQKIKGKFVIASTWTVP